MQDNALRHTADQLKHSIHADNIKIMKCLTQSPDLNATENSWKTVED